MFFVSSRPDYRASQMALVVKNPPANVETHRFDLWVGKIPWKRAWQPTQYSCLENPIDRGVWWATVQGSQRVGHDRVTKHAYKHMPIF